jgi:hypothetical protein
MCSCHLLCSYFFCLDTKEVTRKDQDVIKHPTTTACPATTPLFACGE